MTKEEAYINIIIEETGLTRTEIQKLVDEKKEYLKGLISTEGALFIITKELGIDIKDLNSQKLALIYIVDLKNGMKNVNIIGRIKRIYEIHEFLRRDGTEGKVQNFIIEDKTKYIRTVIWDDHVEKMASEPLFKVNALIQITAGYIKWSDYNNAIELHVSRWGKIEFNPKVENREEYPEIEVYEDEF